MAACQVPSPPGDFLTIRKWRSDGRSRDGRWAATERICCNHLVVYLFKSYVMCIYIYIHMYIYIWGWVKIKDLRGPQILAEFSINHPMIGVPNLTHVHIYVSRKDLKGSCRNLYMRGPMVENCRKPWKAIW